jgi:hypothetical protein
MQVAGIRRMIRAELALSDFIPAAAAAIKTTKPDRSQCSSPATMERLSRDLALGWVQNQITKRY